MKKYNVLYIIPTLELADGITSYAMNYYREFEETNVDFIVTASESKTKYYYELLKNGSNVYYIPSNNIKKIFCTIKNVKNFFKNNAKKYDIIHCHVANTGLLYLYFAKKYNVNIRILHSHATVTADTIAHKIRNDIILPLTKKNANYFFACSNLAGKAMFKQKDFFVVNNAINIDNYRYSLENRKKIRNKLGLDKKVVLGNIGRLCNQKNQLFLIDVFYEIQKKNNNVLLLIAGNGELKEKILDKIREYDIIEKVMLLDNIDYVNELYSAIDYFLLPSLYEGLPMVGVEAQVNGVPCLFSDSITKEIKLNDNVKFLKINKKEDWCKNILEFGLTRTSIENNNNIERFNIKKESKVLENKYKELIKKEKK